MTSAQLERLRALDLAWKNAYVAGDYVAMARLQKQIAAIK